MYFGQTPGSSENLEVHPFSTFHLNLEASLQQEFQEVCFQEELFWLQKSSSEWICMGDMNTSYYHTKVLIRKRRNHIVKLQNNDGEWIEEETQLQQMAVEFYKHLYSIHGSTLAIEQLEAH